LCHSAAQGEELKAKQSGLIKQNHQTSQLKGPQGKISVRERNKISKGTILTKAYATAKRLHFPAIIIHSSHPLLSLRARVIEQFTSQKTPQIYFCFRA